MNAAAVAPHDALLPRAPGGHGVGAALALLVHAGLIVALALSVNWRSSPSEIVAAELWSAVPQVAAPRVVAPPPPPQPAPAPAPTPPPRRVEHAPPPPPPPAEREADIALEKAKKAAAEQERAERLERERQARLKAEQDKAARLKAEREQAAREKAEREQAARLKAEREKAEREKAEREQAAREKAAREAEEKRVAQQREANLRRMMGQIEGAAPSGTGAPNARGTAAVDAAPSQAYGARLKAAIFPNIVFTETYTGNPEAVVEVRAAPNGSIISRRIVRPSGNREWDEAVLQAIDRTGTLPRDTDGRVPPVLAITFKPSQQ